jgi:hypothetical protein
MRNHIVTSSPQITASMSDRPTAGWEGRLTHACAPKILKNASFTDWEDMLEKIEFIFKDPLTSRLSCRVVWKNADVTTHPVKLLHVKCPQRVCHLSLTGNPS